MSDPFISKEFVSDGVNQGPPHIKQWFPAKSVTMSFERVEVTKPHPDFPDAYYKATISDTPARPMIEDAVYVPDGANKLVARHMVAKVGLLLNETVTAEINPETKQLELKHTLAFSDGSEGIWTCK